MFDKDDAKLVVEYMRENDISLDELYSIGRDSLLVRSGVLFPHRQLGNEITEKDKQELIKMIVELFKER
jgi:hypothetical protein